MNKKQLTVWMCALTLLLAGGRAWAQEQDVHALTIDTLGPVARLSFSPVSLAYTQGERLRRFVSLHLEDVPFADALTAVAERAGLNLYYSDEVLSGRTRVSLQLQRATAAEALKVLLEGTDLHVYRSSDGQRLVLKKMMTVEMDVAPVMQSLSPVKLLEAGQIVPPPERLQTGTITGTVTEATTGESLPGVNVVIIGTQQGAATDAEGRYTIEDVTVGEHTVEARFIGYRTERAQVTVADGETQTLNFTLNSSRIELNEVVVSVAAGEVTREEVGVDIATVTPEQLEGAVAVNFSQLLNARAEGVTISQASGNVGAGSTIRVRGISSLTQDNFPLLVIDGIRVSNSTSVGINRGQTFSRFNDIDPKNIKNIQVVKGPAATALYGSEAAAGVIIIETKNGQGGSEGGGAVTFRSEVGTMREVIDFPVNYADVSQFGITDPGDPRLDGWRTAQNPGTGEVYVLDNPFEDARTSPFRTGYSYDNSLSITGSEGTFNYYAALGYKESTGVLRSNFANRLNFRANFQGTLSDALSMSVNTGYVNSAANLPKSGNNTSGFFLNALQGLPLSSQGASGDCLATVLTETSADFCDKDGNVRAAFDDIASIVSKEELERYLVSLSLNYTPFPWMINTLTVGTDIYNQTFQDAIPYDPEVPFGFAEGGENFLTRDQSVVRTADLSSRISYDLFEALSGYTAMGAQYFRERVESVACQGRVFPNDQATACDAAVSFRGFSDFYEKVEIGAYVQQRFSYNDYFFMTGALRVDNNSTLGEEEPPIISPSFNTSLVVSDLPVWQKLNPGFVNEFRLRFAWGKASQSPAPYAANRTYIVTRLAQGDEIVPGLSPSDPGNPNLGPERSEEFEFGLDAGFLDGRLALGFTYYTETTTDAIIARPVAPSLGFPNDKFVNLGQLESHGLEASLDGQILNREGIAWDFRLGLSTAHSEITELGFDEPIFVGFSQVLQGGVAPGAYVSRVITRAERDENGNILPESIEYAPGNLGDDSGRRVVGQPFPTNSQTLSSSLVLFGTLEISTLFERKGGHEILSGTQDGRNPNTLEGLQSSFGALWAYRRTRTTPVEQAMMEQDRLVGNHNAVWIHDADFIKWRELRVTYTLPRPLSMRVGAARTSIYVGARNLATWTSYPGLDPEVNMAGARDNLGIIESNALPPPRMFFGGVRLTF